MHRIIFTSEILQERKKERKMASGSQRDSPRSQRDRSESAKNRSQSLHLLYRTRLEDCLISSGEEDDATVLPSNQANDQTSTSATNVVETPHGNREIPHGSRDLPQQGQEDEEEEDNWNFLTQFIGSLPPRIQQHKETTMSRLLILKQLISGLSQSAFI